jgi:hypothetical protein
MYGGYAVIINIGAIYNDKLWQLIKAFTGIENQQEYDNLVELERIEHEKRDIEYTQKVAEAKAKRDIVIAEAIANFKAPANWQPFNGNVISPGIYAKISMSLFSDGPVLFIFKVKKHGSKLKIATKTFKDLNYIDWQPTEYKITESKTINNGWIIPEVKTQPEPDKPTQPITNDITIRHNEKLNGIEVLFANKPNDSILNTLKTLGYRWSNFNQLWYNHFTDDLMVKTRELIY